MLRNTLSMTLLALVLGGCAGDRYVDTPAGTTSTAGEGTEMTRPTTPVVAATEPTSTRSETESTMTQSNPSRSRIAAGIDEETLDTCLAGIPQDATAGQRMLAEQTCKRNFSTRR